MKEELNIDVSSTVLVDKIDNAVQILAQKLGLATDHFYPIIVQQQVIEAITYIALIIPFIWLTHITKKLFDETKGDERFGYAVLFCVGGVSIAAILAVNLPQLLNPEYYALMEIKDFIK